MGELFDDENGRTRIYDDEEAEPIFIGFDPGAEGGCCVLQAGKVLETIPFPQMKVQSKKASKTRDGQTKKGKDGKNIYAMKDVLDEMALAGIVRRLKVDYPEAQVILEKVKNIQGTGAVSNFNFGYNFGFLSGLIAAVGFPVHLTTPQNWQKHVVTWADKVLNPDMSNDTKASSLKALTRLFPDLDLRPTPRSTKPHDGMVDATLIAYYGWLTMGKGTMPEVKQPEVKKIDIFSFAAPEEPEIDELDTF